MSESTPRSYFHLRLPLWVEAPSHRVEIDFDVSQARLQGYSGDVEVSFDEEVFWRRLEAAGAWEWMTWEEWTKGQQAYFSAEYPFHSLLTIRHGGRERKHIILNDQTDRLALLFELIEKLRPPVPVRPSASRTPRRLYLRLNDQENDIRCGIEVDFERMELRVHYQNYIGDNLGPRSIAGFDTDLFWRRVAEGGIWELPERPAGSSAAGRRHDADGQGILTLCYDNNWRRDLILEKQPEKLAMVVELLRPLTLDPLSAALNPTTFEYFFPQAGPVERDVRSPAGAIFSEGLTAYRLGKEMAAVGFDGWVSDTSVVPPEKRWWEALEWDAVEDDLDRGLPFVPPKAPGIKWGFASQIDEADGPIFDQYVDGEGVRILWGAVFVHAGGYQVVAGNDPRIGLLRFLARYDYQSTLCPLVLRPANSVFDYDGYYGESSNYGPWLSPDDVNPDNFAFLQGESTEETFSYEARLGFDAVASIGPPPAGTIRHERHSCITGMTWTLQRPLSTEAFDDIIHRLDQSGSSEWKMEAGWPKNTWIFRARINGKTYECGGIAATGGGIESPEPDPRLAVLRKILHFAG
jgi:hypothetical protein